MPGERKFWIWRDRVSGAQWHWCCTLCEPPSYGTRQAWEAIMTITLPGHFCRRKYHRDYVRRTAA